MRRMQGLNLLTALTLASFLVAGSVVGVLAKEKPEGSKGHHESSQQDKGNRGHSDDLSSAKVTDGATVTSPGRPTHEARPEERECPSDVDSESEAEEFEWRNHGQFVSCVARGEVSIDDMDTDDAAHSDIGKPDRSDQSSSDHGNKTEDADED